MKEIKLTKNKIAIIDDDDFDRVFVNKWSYHHTGYVVRGKPQISLHRFIMEAKKGQNIDHKNRNKLDNRKENLRFCTRKQNQWNFPYRIAFRKDRNAWILRMNVNGKKKYIGYFKNEELAKEARRKVSLKYHKEFSPYA